MKLIDLHYEWLKEGNLPDDGLCHCVPKYYQSFLCKFEPSLSDRFTLLSGPLSYLFWGSGLPVIDNNRRRQYTPLRQTIVLFICAMCDEI